MRLFFNKRFLLGFSLVCVVWMSEAAIIAAEQGFMAQQGESSSERIAPSEDNPGEPGD